ncbi:MAG: ATP synthase F0 subunit B [Deltaproteobacteria bacterium]|nr:ATP synthase F0 subunit B [Deltaproteobacteria bacterium]
MVVVIASILNFAVVVFILWKFGKKPTVQMFSNRRQSIAQAVSEAEKLAEEATTALKHSRQDCESMAERARRHFEEVKEGLETYRLKAREAAKAQAKRIEEEAKKIAQGELLKAKQLLRREMVDKSIALVSQHLKKSLNDEDKRNLVRGVLEGVRDAQAR